jgi:hypothetical protein
MVIAVEIVRPGRRWRHELPGSFARLAARSGRNRPRCICFLSFLACAREAQPSAPPGGVDLTLQVFRAEVAAGAERDQLPGSHRDRRRDRSGYRGRSRVPALRIRRHRAAVFILGDRAREAIGRRHGARAQRLLPTPAESSVAGATDSARP